MASSGTRGQPLNSAVGVGVGVHGIAHNVGQLPRSSNDSSAPGSNNGNSMNSGQAQRDPWQQSTRTTNDPNPPPQSQQYSQFQDTFAGYFPMGGASDILDSPAGTSNSAVSSETSRLAGKKRLRDDEHGEDPHGSSDASGPGEPKFSQPM